MTDAMPRETLIYSTSGVFRCADYPWLVEVRAIAQGGDGGAAADGTPGGKGTTGVGLIDSNEIGDELRIVIGAPGRGGRRAEDGEPGYVMLELYDQKVESPYDPRD